LDKHAEVAVADGKKSLTRPMQSQLAPGEQLLGGCKAAGKNAVLKSAIGGVAGALIPGSTSDGLAAAIPQLKIFWVGATDQRLVFFDTGAFSSKPRSFRGDVALGSISDVEVGNRGPFRRLTVTFTDGSSSTVDLYRANSPGQLQEALEQVLPGKVHGKE
jgi:hypothetical protein